MLVLELRPPELAEGQRGFGDMLGALGHLRPEYLAHLVSFLTIANAWMSHHGIFRPIARTDQTLVYLNTLLLLVVAVIPFPTALIAEYRNGGAGRRRWSTAPHSPSRLSCTPCSGGARPATGPETPQAALDAIGRRYLFAAPPSLLLSDFGPAPILHGAILYPLSFPIEGRQPRT